MAFLPATCELLAIAMRLDRFRLATQEACLSQRGQALTLLNSLIVVFGGQLGAR